MNTPQRQALENQINNAATRGEVAQKLTEAEALNQAMEALRNSIQDQQQTEAVASLSMKINHKKMLTKQQFKMQKI
ncbi:hypothetical protein UM590_03395 [Staphylococcus aureus]|nr:hypothetical protein UM590_03395 [Staphylococcus aureus]